MWRNRPALFFICVFLIPAFGLGVLLLLSWYLKTRMDELQITSRKIQWVHGLFSKTHVEIDLQQVRTVRVHQNIIQRIFRSGILQIFTAGDRPEIIIRGLPHAIRIKEIIEEQKIYSGINSSNKELEN